jgi:hypothetical protein
MTGTRWRTRTGRPVSVQRALRVVLARAATRRDAGVARPAGITLGAGERVVARQTTRAERTALHLAWLSWSRSCTGRDGGDAVYPAGPAETTGAELLP